MFLFSAIILGLGAITSYTDIRFHKIRNIHLLWATAAALFAYGLLLLTGQLEPSWKLGLSIFLGLTIGMTLYFTDSWGAGDAKLFAVFSLLVTTDKYNTILFVPSLALFANIFLLSLLVMLAITFRQMIRERSHLGTKIANLPYKEGLAKITKTFLIIFCLKWLLEEVMTKFLPDASRILDAVVLFICYRIVYWLIQTLKKKWILALIFGAGLLLRIMFFGWETNLHEMLIQLKITLFYALLFEGLQVIFDLTKPQESDKEIIPFAPLMLIGALLTQSDLLHWVADMFVAVTG